MGEGSREGVWDKCREEIRDSRGRKLDVYAGCC